MKIVVCVKQVPDTADIKWSENNTLIREGAESVVNPYDLYATETALRIEDSHITAISMGPMQAQKALKEVLAMGVNDAILLSDRYFVGADTAATSNALAAAIKTKLSDFDLILCGQYATDGDTAQTGPSLAQKLGVAVATNVKSIEKVEEDKVIVRKAVDDGTMRLEVKLPAVICMLESDYPVRLPSISGRMKAQDYKIPVLTAGDINIKADYIGFMGSPTQVKKVFHPESKRENKIYDEKTAEEAANLIIEKIRGVDLYE